MNPDRAGYGVKKGSGKGRDDQSMVCLRSSDLKRRIEQHNAGTASRYTRSRLPVALEYQEEAPTKSAALKRELAIKALPRKAKVELIRRVEDA